MAGKGKSIKLKQRGSKMTGKDLTTVDQNGRDVLTGREEALVQIVLDSVDSEHTKRAYRRALRDFLGWCAQVGVDELNKAVVQRYAAELRDAGVSASSINQRLSAIRKLGRELADNGALSEATANGIRAVKGVRAEGQRTGRWLSKEEAERLLSAPDAAMLKGKRDGAILAVLIGCGLRRSEAANLTFDHVQMIDGRPAIVNLKGKRNKTRSVPMPLWAHARIEEWAVAAGIESGRIFRAMHKGGFITSDSMSAQAIADVVWQYSEATGLHVAAHDLRRTFSQLSFRGGAALDQIQLSLGHSSIQTTERYLGIRQSFSDAPADRLGLELEN